jgi:phage gp36-like protein
VPYCNSDNLLLGNIPLPAGLDPDNFVADAADEIDSIIGFRYVTPVVESPADPPAYELARPVLLLLKRINVWLASGRLILAVDSAGEDTQLHAYGNKLVNDAMSTLTMIRDGKIDLVGAPTIEEDSPASHDGPVFYNADASSAVDDFYGDCGPMAPNLRGTRVNPPVLTEYERWPV